MQKNEKKWENMRKHEKNEKNENTKTMLFTRNILSKDQCPKLHRISKYEEFVKHHCGAETCSCLLSFNRFKIIWWSLLSLNRSLHHWGGAGQSNKCCISCSYMEFQVVGLPFLTQMNLNYNQFSLLYQLIFVFMLAVFCIISLL